MSVLVVSPHPDDETLGCGGTIFKHKKEGKKIYWLLVTGMFRDAGFTEKKIKQRDKEIDAVAKAYGFTEVFNLNLPATRLDTLPLVEIIEKVHEVIKKISPKIIYLPYKDDLHTDHQITHNVVIASTKPFRTPGVEKIFAYETISETELGVPSAKNAFAPNVFVDITPFMDKKIKIMKLYKDEIKKFPFPRSEKNMKTLAAFRGATMGMHYAEAFMLLREFVL